MALALFPGHSWASGILFQFNTPFPNDPSPAGAAPWIDASFQDIKPGTVLLTITNVNLTAGEFVGGNGSGANGGLFFNLNPALKASQLNFTLTGSSGSFADPSIKTGANSFKADGDGYYDILFDFATAGWLRFGARDSISYLITGIPNLTAADFGYLSAPSTGGSGPFYAAAHIQGIPLLGSSSTSSKPGSGSTWVEPCQLNTTPVPEPATLSVLGLGAACAAPALAARRRRQV